MVNPSLAALAAGGILLLWAPLPASSDPSLNTPDNRPSDKAQLVERFLQAHPGTALSLQADRIGRVYGQAFSHGQTAEHSAEQFRLNHAGMFGVEPQDLVERGPFPDGHHIQPMMYDQDTGRYKFTGFNYTQVKDGIEVFRSRLTLLVRNEPGFPLVLASADLRDLGDFQVPANAGKKINAQRAHQAAAPQVAKDTQFSDPQPVIWVGVDDLAVPPRLAVQFVATSGSPADPATYEKWLFLVDAKTGRILYQEDQILHEDVVGNVSGRATQGWGADICGAEVAVPLPYARVNIVSGAVAYADENGDFIIPNAGTSQVTVESRIWGDWFRVYNQGGSDSLLSGTVIPPGPVNFLHNASNTSELVRAEVNGYVHANIVRDFVLNYNPDFPVITGQHAWTVNVNLSSNCNAFYDGNSINFYTSGGGCPNTAFSVVVHHEYGHHLVQVAGSGQDAYGEGFGDVMGVLISDDPVLAYGFYGNCNAGIRTADNTLQYPCSGEIHYCGQLLSGCVWSTRNELLATNPSTYRDILSNLAVNSVLLHTGSSITPQITIDFLTLDDDDGNIFNGTPHYQEINAGFSDHNMPGPELAAIGFEYPAGRPDLITPNQATIIPVNVVPVKGTPIPGTGTVSYRIGTTGSFTTDPMDEISPNEYEATLPGADCPETIQYYFSAEAVGAGTFSDPPDAPSSTFSAIAATGTTTELDDFETNTGWTVGAPGDDATTGVWVRVDPNGTAAQPENDHTPAPGTLCFVTGQGSPGGPLGENDVDGGKTTLTSPLIDLSDGGNAFISYWRWYSNDTGASPNADVFVVDISNNNGSTWTNVETVGPSGPETSGGWFFHEFVVTDFVTPSAQMRMRFIASDEGSGSLVEAAVDDFAIGRLLCEPSCPADLDGDGTIGPADLAMLLTCWGTPCGDLNNDGTTDPSDLAILLANWGPCP